MTHVITADNNDENWLHSFNNWLQERTPTKVTGNYKMNQIVPESEVQELEELAFQFDNEMAGGPAIQIKEAEKD